MTSKIVKEPVMDGVDVARYVEQLTPSKLKTDIMELAHDISQLSSMMSECRKQAMATVVVADITVHVEMKMGDEPLFESRLGHTAEPREEIQV
jgi:hypothetical protein